jgi:hypothetical protein
MDWWLLVSYVGVFAVGALAGYYINDWIIRSTFGQMLEQAGVGDKDLDQFVDYWKEQFQDSETQAPKLQITLEQVDGEIFCYSKDTGKFLGQAKDREGLVDVLTQRLGPVTLFIQPEDGADLIKDEAQ